MPLSDVVIRKAKPADKAQRLFDGGGLYLEITPAGSKLWRQKYRHAGKEKLLAHGTYPEVSLAQARERREDARKLLANGIDPGEQKKALKAAGEERATNSFEAIAREWHGKFSKNWATSHSSKIMGRLRPAPAAIPHEHAEAGTRPVVIGNALTRDRCQALCVGEDRGFASVRHHADARRHQQRHADTRG